MVVLFPAKAIGEVPPIRFTNVRILLSIAQCDLRKSASFNRAVSHLGDKVSFGSIFDFIVHADRCKGLSASVFSSGPLLARFGRGLTELTPRLKALTLSFLAAFPRAQLAGDGSRLFDVKSNTNHSTSIEHFMECDCCCSLVGNSGFPTTLVSKTYPNKGAIFSRSCASSKARARILRCTRSAISDCPSTGDGGIQISSALGAADDASPLQRSPASTAIALLLVYLRHRNVTSRVAFAASSVSRRRIR